VVQSCTAHRAPRTALLSLLFLFLFQGISVAQDEVNPDTLPVQMLTTSYQSPVPVTIPVAAVLRFSGSADLYLEWAPVSGASSYTIQLYAGDQLISTQTVSSDAPASRIIENLPLNTEMVLRITPNGSNEGNVIAGSRSVSTYKQREPIEVSQMFYNQLSDWFSNTTNDKGLCEYLGTANVHDYEKLSFVQAYSFDGKAFVKSTGATELSDWYPTDFQPTNSTDCVPIDPGKCRCRVITNGALLASPGTLQTNGSVTADVTNCNFTSGGDQTSFNRNNAGPAKFWSARQHEMSGGANFQYSNAITNTNGLGGPAAQQASLSYFLGCTTNSGAFNTNIPEDCQCERPLHLYYSYTTTLFEKARKRTCPWSKAAGAQAEDMAFVTVLEGKTGMPNIIAAGANSVARQCNSNWNATFFTRFVDVAAAVGQYLATSGIGGSGTPTPPTAAQITAFANALNALIPTPAFIKSGDCGESTTPTTLIEGSKTLQLKPNIPVMATMHSTGYIRVWGYGCYEAAAAIASDYYLLGVVESQLVPEDPECCVDKFVQYIVGSQSGPDDVDLPLQAFNSTPTRLAQVGFLMAQFGSWNGYSTNPFTGSIILNTEFGRNYGVSCSQLDPHGQVRSESIVGAQVIRVYPTLTHDQLQVEFDSDFGVTASFSVIDAFGRTVHFTLPAVYSKGVQTVSLNAHNLPKGNYLLKCNLGKSTETHKFQTH
jgi:hypothetical protein